MKASGAMDGLMRGGISSLARDSRWVAFLIPSLMGFLSVPGAAVFSAPMVDSVGDALDMSPEQKVTANIMFRHACTTSTPPSQRPFSWLNRYRVCPTAPSCCRAPLQRQS